MRTGELDEHAIEDLSAATMERVARRLACTPDEFEELVYRETELDALWSLTDLAIATSAERRGGRPSGERPTSDDPTIDHLVRLRELINNAHELVAVGRPHDAVGFLVLAARLCAERAHDGATR